MKKSNWVISCFILVTMALIMSLASCTQEEEIEITVSPSVLNLESNGGSFSIHSNLKYSADMNVTVYIDGDRSTVSSLSTSADSRGELVVSFDILDMKKIVSTGPVVINLVVHTRDGKSYSGTDEIDVIDRGK